MSNPKNEPYAPHVVWMGTVQHMDGAPTTTLTRIVQTGVDTFVLEVALKNDAMSNYVWEAGSPRRSVK